MTASNGKWMFRRGRALALALAASLAMAAAARAGEARARPVEITDDWSLAYIWKDAKRGMNLYDGFLTLKNIGKKPLEKIEVVAEAFDIVSGKAIAQSDKPAAADRLEPGGEREFPVVIPHSPKGDEIVIRVSAAPQGGARATWTFSTPDHRLKPLPLDPRSGELRLLGQRLESGKIGKNKTSMTLYLRVMNLSAKNVSAAHAELETIANRGSGRKVRKETKKHLFTVADAKKPLSPGRAAILSFDFQLEGELERHAVVLRLGAAEGATAGGPAGKNDLKNDDDGDEDDEDENDESSDDGGGKPAVGKKRPAGGGEDSVIEIGEPTLVKEGGRAAVRFTLTNRFEAGRDPKRVHVDVLVLDDEDEEIKTYPLVIAAPAEKLPRGKAVEQKVFLEADVAKRLAAISVRLTAE